MQLIQVQINQNSLDAEPTIKLQSKHMMQKVETTVIWIMIRYRYYISMIMIPYNIIALIILKQLHTQQK